MSPPASDAGTAARLRALLADVVELVQVRLELFTVLMLFVPGTWKR